jgi:hypothetical protein
VISPELGPPVDHCPTTNARRIFVNRILEWHYDIRDQFESLPRLRAWWTEFVVHLST